MSNELENSEEIQKQMSDWDRESVLKPGDLKMPVEFRFDDKPTTGLQMEVTKPKPAEMDRDTMRPKIVSRPKNKSALF